MLPWHLLVNVSMYQRLRWTLVSPWHCRYFLTLSKPIYPGAPMISTRRNFWTSLLRPAGCPNTNNTGSIYAQRTQGNMRRTHRMNRQRCRWMPRSVRLFPPVNDCDPSVSRAVEPPNATHQPREDYRGISSKIEKIRYSPVTKASIREKAATDNSSGPNRPATTTETVWMEFCNI